MPSAKKSKKTANIALLLCIFLGLFGAHRFYAGKIITGLLMLLTLGGVGIWWLFDLTQIANGDFTDKHGNYLAFTKERTAFSKTTCIIVGGGLLTICCYLALFIFIVFYVANPMTLTVQNQLSALRAGDMDKAYSYMATQTTDNVSLMDFKEYMQRYPVITDSTDISFSQRKFANNEGFAQGELKTADGREANVEYLLTKQIDGWKIVAIRIGQTHYPDDITNVTQKTYKSYFDRYIIKYPSNWYFQQTAPHAVLFNGQEGTPSYFSSITIEATPNKTAGGTFENVNEAINALKQQISFRTTNTKFIESGAIDLPNEKVHGEYFIVSYTFEGRAMKKMQFILAQDGRPTIYSWDFTSTSEQYEKDLPIAKTMYESWKFE